MIPTVTEKVPWPQRAKRREEDWLKKLRQRRD